MATAVKENKNSDNKETKKRKRRLSMPHTFTLLFLIIIVVMIITWVAPSGYYVGDDFFSAGIQQEGIIDAFMSIGYGFLDAASLIFFLFGIGAFINIVIRSEAMEAAIGSSLKKLKNKEVWLIPAFMLFFAFGGTIYGMAEETLAFYLILVPVFILAGFDAITGVFVILLGAGVGVLASTVNPFAIGAAVDASNAGGTDISVGTGMASRWVAFIIFYLAATLFVVWYAKRVKANQNKSYLDEETRQLHEEWARENYNLNKLPQLDRRKIITLVVFILSLLWMVFVLIPWDSFGINIFVDASSWVAENAAWLSANQAWTIGWWYFLELGVFFILLAVIVGYINRGKQETIYRDMVSGASDMLGVGLVIAVARGVSVLLAGTTGDLKTSTQLIESADLAWAGTDWDSAITAGSIDLYIEYNSPSGLVSSVSVDITANWIDLGGGNYGWDPNGTYFTMNDVLAGTVNSTFDQTTAQNLILSSELNEGLTVLSVTGTGNAQYDGISTLVFSSTVDGEVETLVTDTVSLDVNLTNSLLNSMSGVSNMGEVGFSVTVYGIYIPLSFLIPSTSGLAGATFGIMGPLADQVATNFSAVAVTGFAFAEGIVNLMTPTSGVVMGGLAIAKVSYGSYLKSVWRFLLIVLILSAGLMALFGVTPGFSY